MVETEARSERGLALDGVSSEPRRIADWLAGRGLTVIGGSRLREKDLSRNDLAIRRTLEEVTDPRQKAARILGISARALHYKVARYGVPGKRRVRSGGGLHEGR